MTTTQLIQTESYLMQYLHDRYPGTSECIFRIERRADMDAIQLNLLAPGRRAWTQIVSLSFFQQARHDTYDNDVLVHMLKKGVDDLGYQYSHPAPPEVKENEDLKKLLELLD